MNDMVFDKNYLVFGMKTLNITQTASGTFSHRNSSAYPTDVNGGTVLKEAFYCPCDKVVVKKVYNDNVNAITVWYEAYDVYLPIGFRKKACFTLSHINKSDLDALAIKVGKTFKFGDIIYYEGTSGKATGNHIHIECSDQGFSGTGWSRNSKGKLGINNPIKIENMFYLISNYTIVKDTKGLKFKYIRALTTSKNESADIVENTEPVINEQSVINEQPVIEVKPIVEIGLFRSAYDNKPVKTIQLKKYKIDKIYTKSNGEKWLYVNDNGVIGWIKATDYKL